MGECEVERGAKGVANSGARSVPSIYHVSKENQFEVVEEGDIPVIDLRCFIENADSSKQDQLLAVKKVAEACQKWGFFQVINHGVDQSIISNMFRAAHDFFELDPEEKNKHTPSDRWKDIIPDPFGLFSYGVSFKGQAAKSTDWRDWVRFEGMLAGKHDAFPKNPPSFKDAAIEYESALDKLDELLLRMISQGLGLEPGTMRNLFGETPRKYVLLNLYPKCPAPELVAGLSSHSDPLALTVLAQDQVPGLEVFHQGNWMRVNPIPGAFVVNLGDLMQILTNGRYQSVNHRVRANAQERLTLASQLGPSLSSMVAPIPQLVSEREPARYKACSTSDYMNRFYELKLQGKSCLDYVAI